MQSSSTRPHAGGESGEVSSLTKHFCSVTATQRSPKQLKQMGTYFGL